MLVKSGKMNKLNFVAHLTPYLSNKVLRSTLIYTIAGGFNAAIPFFILPVLTAYLSPEEYGVVSTFMVFNSIFLIVIGIEQYSFISVNFYTHSSEEIRGYISNIITISFLLFFFFILSAILFSTHFQSISQVRAQWILFSVIVAFFQFLSQVGLTVWQLNNEPFRYGLYQVLHSLFNYSLSIFLIAQFRLGEGGRIWGITISAMIFGLYSLFYLFQKKLISYRISVKDIKSSLIFSLPLVPHAFAGWINTASDRLIINNYVGISETGIYSINYQIAMVISLLAGSFNRAFIPFIFKTLSKGTDDGKIKLVRYTYFYYITLIILALLLALTSPYILELLVNEKYQKSQAVIYWIIIGFTADGLYYGVINYLFYAKKTTHISLITFSSCILHFIISFFLIPRIGVIGAAYSTSVSFVFSFIIAWIVSNKAFPMPWSLTISNFNK